MLSLAVGDVAALKQLSTNPGSGINQKSIVPYKEYFKDGFAAVDCVQDYMLLHGDKHGDGKFAYKTGASANVSIIHYTEVVPKVDQKATTPSVCFEFCRTVPDMGFFGLTNGRDCYCSSFFKQMAGDSSECDAPCDGDNSKICGGKTKSSIFSMHACNDAKGNLEKAAKEAGEGVKELEKLAESVEESFTYMEATANTAKDQFGKVGDSEQSGLSMKAIGSGNKHFKTAKDAAEHASTMGKMVGDAGSFAGTPVEMEKLTKSLQTGAAKMASMIKDLSARKQQIEPVVDDPKAIALYYPIMYFVDKKYKDTPTTCGGDLATEPAVATYDGCAAACENAVNEGCAGFQFVAGDNDKGLCYLMKKFDSAIYYNGCEPLKSFVQTSNFMAKKGGEAATNCMVKFSDFNGLDLTPDKSGKNKMSLKSAKKWERCWK